MNNASAHRRRVSSPRDQSGVVLVTGLILLAVMTLLGLTAMRSSTQGTRMAVNHQHKQQSFQTAENALTKLMGDNPSVVAPPTVPGTVWVNPKADDHNSTDPYFTSTGVQGQPDLSADLRVEYLEERRNLLVSGFGVNRRGFIYQADAQGRVDGTGAQTTNRMGIALIR